MANIPNDNPLAELTPDELTGPNHLCRTLIPSDAVVFEIRRRLERLAIVETELATAKSDRRGLLGLVRAELEDHCPKGEKMNLLDLTKAVLERLAKCEADTQRLDWMEKTYATYPDSRWLMGLPAIWDQAAIAAFRLLKARKRGLRGFADTETA